MQTRCDYHICPECEYDVVHIVQDGICREGDYILCDACAAANETDPEPDHDCLLPLMCGQRDPMSVAYGFTPDTDDTVYCANAPSDDDAEGCTAPPFYAWSCKAGMDHACDDPACRCVCHSDEPERVNPPPVDEWTRTRHAPIASDPTRPLDYLATFERALRGRD